MDLGSDESSMGWAACLEIQKDILECHLPLLSHKQPSGLPRKNRLENILTTISLGLELSATAQAEKLLSAQGAPFADRARIQSDSGCLIYSPTGDWFEKEANFDCCPQHRS